MSSITLAMILVYWVFLVGAVLVMGSFASRAFVTNPSGAEFCVPGGRRRCLGESAARGVFAGSLVALAAYVVHFVLHVAVVTETPLGEVSSVLYPFLVKTKFGRFALIRNVFLIGIILTAWYSIRRSSRGSAAVGIVFSVPLLVTLSMAGHQGAKGYLTVPFFLDVFHSLAVVAWIGGIFHIRLGYAFLLKSAGIELWDISVGFIRKFSRLATWGVVVALLTGVVLSVLNIESLARLTGTFYGLVLLGKAAVVGIIALLGGMNKFFLIPLLDMGEKTGPHRLVSLKQSLHLAVTAEMGLGLVALLLTSFLTHLSPEG